MQNLTTFNQVIDGETFTITLPENRVTAVINRVDRMIDKNKFEQALEVITPFIGNAPVIVETAENNVGTVSGIVAEFSNKGRFYVMEKLMGIGLSKSSAYYQVRKANL